MYDDGKVVTGVMRRDSSKEKRIRNDWGKDKEHDPFLKLKLKHGYLFDEETEDPKVSWPSHLAADVHTGLAAGDILEVAATCSFGRTGSARATISSDLPN